MDQMRSGDVAQDVLNSLREHQGELRRAGIRGLSLFGSVARGEATPDSDIDLVAEFDASARMDMICLSALERQLANILGRKVDVLPDPVENPHLRASIERDRCRAF